MSKYIGRRCELGVAVEATRGTAINPTLWIPWTSISFEDKVTKEFEKSGLGRIEDTDQAYVVGTSGEGSIEGEIKGRPLGAILYATFGTVSSALVEAGVYDHTYSLANTNIHKSLCLLAQDPDRAEMYAMAMVDKFELKVEPEKIVSYTVDFISKGSADWSNQTSSYTTADYKFLPQHCHVKFATNQASLAAASETIVKGLTFTVSKNVAKDQGLGTVQPVDIVNQQFSIEGEVTLNRNDDTFKNLFTGDSTRAMEIKFTNPTTIGAVSNPTLTIQLGKVFFQDWKQDRKLDDLVEETVPFKAVYDTGNAQSSLYTCVLRNTIASY